MTARKRFVSWVAVSSLPQAKKISLTEQRKINLQHIERHNGVVVADLMVDESRDIPELSEACERIEAYRILRDIIKSGGCDVVICLTRSRLGRVLALVETIAELCRRSNILIYETDSPPPMLDGGGDANADLLTGAVRSWSAQREIEELRRRNRMGMLGKFKKGEFLSGVPWGWRAVPGERGKVDIEIDPVAAETIRTAFITLYCEQGVGAQYISDELNARKLYTATGMEWTRRTAANLFRMVYRYAGYSEINLYSRGKRRPYARTKGIWPPIITDDELDRILKERQARRGKRGVGNAATYRFSLMVYCERCGSRMACTYQTRSDGRRVIFSACENTTHRNRNIFASVVLEKVREFFELMKDEERWPLHLGEDGPDASDIDIKTAHVHDEIRKAEQNILRADDRLIDGTFDEARHAHQVRRLREQIQHLNHDLTELHDRRAVLDRASRKLDRIREIAERGIAYLEMEDERAANALLRPLIRIWAKDRKVHRIEVI